MKNADVTSCGHSKGWPTTRAATSRSVVDVKPTRHTPQSRISARSSASSARHFTWRSAAWTRSARSSIALFDRAADLQDFFRVRAEALRQLILQRLGDLDEARLVDAGHDLDAELLQPVERLVLERDRLRGLLRADLGRRGLHPALLLVRQRSPQLIADPDHAVIGLVLGHRQHRRNFIMLVAVIDVHAILGEVDDAGLQRCVDAAERHVDGLRAIGGEQSILGWSRLNADLVAVEVADRGHRPLAIEIAKTE